MKNILITIVVIAAIIGAYFLFMKSGPNIETPNTGDGAPETGTISGTITTSPTCPVERMPPEPQCAPRAYATSIEIRQIGKTAVLKTIKSNESGTFSAELSVGSFELKPISGAVFPSCAPVIVQVRTGQNSMVDISCDSGIR